MNRRLRSGAQRAPLDALRFPARYGMGPELLLQSTYLAFEFDSRYTFQAGKAGDLIRADGARHDSNLFQ